MRQSDFDLWFESQYGGLPNDKQVLEYEESIQNKRAELCELERRRDRLVYLQQAYTAALYARQAFGLRRKQKGRRG